MKLSKICSEIITYSFYTLFFAVPLFWLPVNSELFEFNKMLLVYFLTVVILAGWIIKGLAKKELIIKRTPLDIPILIFLLANIASTIFSLDPHTSIFGYYGRWNGGLLSTIAYISLYYALISNSDKKQAVYYLATILFSGILVALYGVLQHPNPFFQEKVGATTIFHGIDYDFWAVDVENRVFGTLGQPNWLAAFAAMIIFPLLSFLFIFKKYWQKTIIFLFLAVVYLAFTFTYSRGGTVGLLAGTATFVILLPFYSRRRIPSIFSPWINAKATTVFRAGLSSAARVNLAKTEDFKLSEVYKETLFRKILHKVPFVDLNFLLNRFKNYFGFFLALLILVLVVNQFFGNAISRRGGLTTTTSGINTQTVNQPRPQPTQLEVGGTQTAKIRTIVWTGSINIFKHYPIFGTGLETFGYSYYLFRPVEHNLTAEWDYLYNKAHNEYLNYLSTTGSFGFLSYLFLILLFEFVAIKIIVKSEWTTGRFLSLGLLSGTNSYLLQNFFGFSVVPIALLFFLFPALFFVINQTFVKKEVTIFSAAKFKFLRSKLGLVSLSLMVGIFSVYLSSVVISMWLSDYFYNNSLSSTNYQTSIRQLRVATKLTPGEPIYKTELAVNLAGLASATKNKVTIKQSKKEAREIINKVVEEHPNNTYLWQTKRQIDFTLSQIDKSNYLELLRSAEKLKKLAPTDAAIQYNIALVYSFIDEPNKAEKQLEKVTKLKTDYQEAIIMLARTYNENNKKAIAIKLLKDWLKKSPNDSEAQDLLNQLLTK